MWLHSLLPRVIGAASISVALLAAASAPAAAEDEDSALEDTIVDTSAPFEFAATSPTLTRWSPMLDAAGLDTLVAKVFDTALAYLESEPWELGFEKRYVKDDTFRLAVVDLVLEDPLALPAWQAATVAEVRQLAPHVSALFASLGQVADAALPSGVSSPVASGPERTASAPVAFAAPSLWAGQKPGAGESASFDQALNAFVADLDEVSVLLERAFERVEPGEREHVLMGAASAWGSEDDPEDVARKGMLHFEANSVRSGFGTLVAPADTTVELSADIVLDAAAKVDRSALTEAMVLYLDAAERMSTSMWSLEKDSGKSIVALSDTPYGTVLVGGVGNNIYSKEALEEAVFVFDLGGDDVYRGRAASAVGGIFQMMGLVVDLGGNDFYDARSHPYSLGGALFGLAALVDLGGDDVYRGDDGSLGAGFFGCGLLLDQSGRDEFVGRNFSQGAASVGLGVLISSADENAPVGPELNPDYAYEAGLIAAPGTGATPIRHDENDHYAVSLYGQGFAGTYGVGLLYDTAGHDSYRAGGRYLHAPLLPNDFQSLSQGFSIGQRPRAAGGVGILMDESGNDTYNAEVFAQGTAYFYSIGLLFDGGGNDRYHATQYAQGAGVHLAIGSLWDRGGDDQFVSKFGVTQGFAHDLSVGLLVDETGMDYYTVSDGHGVSLNNSVAIFIDGHGDDIYATARGGRGVARYGRGFSGAAFFVDLEGNDTYPSGQDAENSAVWSTTNYSVGFDLDRDVEFPGEEVPEIVLTAADSIRAIDELFETASRWEVGSDRERVRRARIALKTRGMDAVDYLTGRAGPYPDGEPLATQAGLVYRPILETARAHPDSFIAGILPRLGDPDEQIQKNVIRLLGDLKAKVARAALENLIADENEEDLRNRAMGALGKIGLSESAPVLRPFLSDEKETRRLAAINALKAIRDSASVSLFVDALADSELTVRSAAISVVRTMGECSISDLASDLGSPLLDPNRAAKVKVLGMIGVALKDSARAESIAARNHVQFVLFSQLDRPAGADGRAPTEPGTVSWPLDAPAASEAAARAAAIKFLLQFDDPEIEARLRAKMEYEHDPLVRRSYDRAIEQADQRAARKASAGG